MNVLLEEIKRKQSGEILRTDPGLQFVDVFTKPAQLVVFDNDFVRKSIVAIDSDFQAGLGEFGSIAEDTKRGKRYFHSRSEEIYVVVKTPAGETKDEQIISHLNVELSSFDKIATTAIHLIKLSEQNKGPLYKLSLLGQNDFYIGYTMLLNDLMKSVPHCVFLRQQQLQEKKLVHSICVREAPRTYKKDQHIALEWSVNL